MINVSKEFLEEMRTRTDFKPAASIKLSDGTVLNVDSSDFTLSNNSLVDGASESSLPLGVAIQKNIQLEIVNDDGKYSNFDFSMAEITLTLEFELSDSVESIKFGKYTVVNPYTRGSTIIVTAVDDMYKADMPYDTALSFPATIGAMLRDSCSATGISLDSSEFPNNNFIVSEKPNGYTHRQIIGFIAMIAGGNARINQSGYLEILPYDLLKFLDGGNFSEWIHENTVDGGAFNPWTTGIYISGGEFSDFKKYHVLSNWLNDPKIDTDDIVITGVQTSYTEENVEKNLLIGSEGYVLKIENPLISGKEQEALEYISANLMGSTFRQFTGDHISYPLAEFMDAVIVVDRNGNIYNSFITDIDFSFLGMTILKNSATPFLSNSRSYTSSKTEVIRQAKKLIAHEKNEREKAIEKLNETLANSSGMYVTAEKKPDNSVIYYAHNKPTLAESDIVWKYTSEAIAVSTDGGVTYSYGFSVTGEMIAKILNAEGVNADWINAGSLKVTDKSGKIIFMVDMDTKEVLLSGDSITIGDKNLSEILEDSSALNLILSNEYYGVPADYAGNIIHQPDIGFEYQVLYGLVDVTSDCSIAFSTSDGVVGEKKQGKNSYIIQSFTEDSGWVDVTATYLRKTVTKRFNFSKIKNGTPGRTYEIELSANSIKVDEVYSDGSVKLVPETLVASAFYRDGNNAEKKSYSGRWKLEAYTESGRWVDVETSVQDQNYIEYNMIPQGLTVPVLKYTLFKITLFAAGGTTEILDSQTLPVLWDINTLTNKDVLNLLTNEDVFNLLTNNGEVKGIYKEGNQLYISFNYAKGGTLILGGANDKNGQLKLFNSKNEIVGYLDNTGFGFNSNDSDGYEREVKLRNGGMYFYKEGSVTGLIRRIAWGNDYDASEGIMFGTHSKYLAIGYSENGYKAGYILNNGLNPDGYTERNIFYGLTRFTGNIYADYRIAFSNGAYFSKGLLGENQAIFLRGSGFYVDGNISCGGSKNRVVNTENYGKRALNAFETAEPYFSDIGSGVIDSSGKAVIEFETIFSETIETDVPYQVFITPTSELDCRCIKKERGKFTMSGDPGATFDYMICAKQKGYANVRLDRMDMTE